MKSAKKRPNKALTKSRKKRNVQQFLKKTGTVIGDMQKYVELIQINQIELEHQNEELRITEGELEVSRNKYVNLFDFSPIPYFALDPDGFIKKVNLTGAKMLSVDRSKLIDKSFHSYIPREEKSKCSSFMKTVFLTTEKQSCKLNVESKDKKVFYVLMEAVMLDFTLEAERLCQIALIDLTEFKKLEESYNQVIQELKTLKAVKNKS